MLKPYFLATVIFTVASSLQAGVQVRFIEGAPKDRFVLENVGSCDLVSSTLGIDLSPSTGRLVFDVTEAGAGVEVFQPLELVQGEDALLRIPSVVDGQSSIEFEIFSLAAGDKIAFTIDVDDTIGQREITVSGLEIEGATVSYFDGAKSSTGVFSSDASANVTIADC